MRTSGNGFLRQILFSTFVDEGKNCELTSCGEVLGIYVATYYWNVMSNMLSIYVATAGIVCVKVCTSIDKPIYSVL